MSSHELGSESKHNGKDSERKPEHENQNSSQIPQRAQFMSPARILSLQRLIGNRAVEQQLVGNKVQKRTHPAIQRMPVYQVEPDNPANYDPDDVDNGEPSSLIYNAQNVADEWEDIVNECLVATSDGGELDAMLAELQTNQFTIEFILANRENPAKTAGGQTINPQVPAVYQNLVRMNDEFDVSMFTAPPLKRLQIKVFKQQIGTRAELSERYKLSRAQIHGTIIHELVMHALLHWRLMKKREALVARPERIPATAEALNQNNIPGMMTDLHTLDAARQHKHMPSWAKKGQVSSDYQGSIHVSRNKVMVEHINDIFEHIGKENLDTVAREGLVGEIQTIAGNEPDNIELIRAIVSQIDYQEEDAIRSEHPVHGYPKNDDLKDEIRDNLVPLRNHLRNTIIHSRGVIMDTYNNYMLHPADDRETHIDRLHGFLAQLAPFEEDAQTEYDQVEKELNIADPMPYIQLADKDKEDDL